MFNIKILKYFLVVCLLVVIPFGEVAQSAATHINVGGVPTVTHAAGAGGVWTRVDGPLAPLPVTRADLRNLFHVAGCFDAFIGVIVNSQEGIDNFCIDNPGVFPFDDITPEAPFPNLQAVRNVYYRIRHHCFNVVDIEYGVTPEDFYRLYIKITPKPEDGEGGDYTVVLNVAPNGAVDITGIF
ncbi:MAG: hypothetical protein LBI26_03340 [Holosporales bacterium]|jgi:hypothetical protein|nr:hypothetical protein [Holosporales bacterium]